MPDAEYRYERVVRRLAEVGCIYDVTDVDGVLSSEDA